MALNAVADSVMEAGQPLRHFQLRALHRIPIDETLRARMQRCVAFMQSPTRLVDWAQQALAEQRLTAPSLFSDDDAACRSSFFGRWNFLCFRDGADYFYIVQQRDALFYGLYVPSLAIFISKEGRAHPHQVQLKALQLQLATHGMQPENAERHDGSFQGFFTSQPRPYHVLYDRLPFVQQLVRMIAPTPLPVVTCNNTYFVSISELLGAQVNERMLEAASDAPILGDDIKREMADALNAMLVREKGFVLSPNPSSAAKQNLALRQALFHTMHDYVPAEPSQLHAGLVQAAAEADVVLWIGICSEKRQWLEQIEGLTHILDDVAARAHRVMVVFDSMTAPEGADTQAYRLQFPSDIALYERMKERYAGRIDLREVIGCTVAMKLQVARHIDFFFTHSLTDSMVVAAMARKPGIAYECEGNPGVTIHLHPRTYHMPSAEVIPSTPYEHAWKLGDFSMSPQRVAQLVALGLDEVLRAKRPIFVARSKYLKVQPSPIVGAASDVSLQLPDGKVEYLPLYETSPSLDDAGERLFPISAPHYHAMLDIWTQDACSASLCVVAYADTQKLEHFFVKAGLASSITFPESTTHYRLFLRCQGQGVIRMGGIQMQPLPQSVAKEPE